MTLPVIQAVCLDETTVCSIDHLADVSGLSLDELEDLVEMGLLQAADLAPPARAFHLVHVVTVRQAARIKDDFQLDRNGLALAMTLLRRIASLEHALRSSHAQQPALAPSKGQTP